MCNKNTVVQIICCMTMFISGYIIYSFEIFLPFGLDRCILATGFLLTGNLLKRIYSKAVAVEKRYVLICFISMIIWILCGVFLNQKVSMYAMQLGNYWMFVISGISGTLTAFTAGMWVDKKTQFFARLSRNSIIIVCTHYIVVSVFRNIIEMSGIAGTWINNIVTVLFAAALIYCYIPVCSFINKRFPILNGIVKERKNK